MLTNAVNYLGLVICMAWSACTTGADVALAVLVIAGTLAMLGGRKKHADV